MIAQLGDDLNWWVSETAIEPSGRIAPRGLLDPRQVAHLIQALADYAAYGLHEHHFANAFQVYNLEAEIDEGRVRLTLADEGIYNTAEQFFALPLSTEESDGPYDVLLQTLSAAQIRRVNATQQLAQACTADEMYEELDGLDSDRYFSAEAIHVFKEISEILAWSPGEWDDSHS